MTQQPLREAFFVSEHKFYLKVFVFRTGQQLRFVAFGNKRLSSSHFSAKLNGKSNSQWPLILCTQTFSDSKSQISKIHKSSFCFSMKLAFWIPTCFYCSEIGVKLQNKLNQVKSYKCSSFCIFACSSFRGATLDGLFFFEILVGQQVSGDAG